MKNLPVKTRFAGALVLSAILLLVGCGKNKDAPPPVTPAATEYVNAKDPQWVHQSTPPAKVAVVFIHGLTGDTLSTWTNPGNGRTFFDLLKASPKVGPQVDVFAFGFTSNIVRSGSFDVREAANKLHESLKFNGVLDYPGIVFVAHSMGGLVTLRYLVNHRELIDKVPLVALYATPQEGSQIALIGQYVLNNAATRQMVPADGNDFLKLLNDDWRSLPVRPRVVCGYEKMPIAETVTVVPWSSSTRFCDGASLPIAETNHFTIVKPDRPQHDSVVMLVNALNEHVVGKQLSAKLETPDFVQEPNRLVFTLSDPNGKSTARLMNTGRTSLKYTLGGISDPSLYLWPDDDGPRELQGGRTDRMAMALGYSATATEYRFVLTHDGTPLPVVVLVKDPGALSAKRAELQKTAVQALNAHLDDPRNMASLQSPGKAPDEAKREAVAVVQAAVARQLPDLPPSAQWTLTADVLAASNWPQLAQSALRQAEQQSPSVARSPAGQRLAGEISAAAGVDRVFATVQVPKATPTTAPRLGSDPQQLASSSELAAKLQRVPALRGFGLSLQGDVLQAQGQRDAARQVYMQAAEVQNIPSITQRLRMLDKPGAAVRPTEMIANQPPPKQSLERKTVDKSKISNALPS